MGHEARGGGRAGSRPRARHKRRWLVPACVLICLVLGEAFAGWIGPKIPRKSGAEERAFIKADQMYGMGHADVLILGSSETAGGLLPGTIGAQAPQLAHVYNGALAGTELPLYREWADRVALPALHPKVVVISMVPMAVSHYGAGIKTGELRKLLKSQGISLKAIPANPNEAADSSYQAAFDQIAPGGLGSYGWRLRQYSSLVRYRAYLRRPSLVLGGLRAGLGLDDAPEHAPLPPTGMDWKTETDPAVVRANTASTGEVFDYRSPSIPLETDPLGAVIYRVIEQGKANFGDLEALVRTIRSHHAIPVIALAPVDRMILQASGLDFARFDALTGQVKEWAGRNHVPVNDSFTPPLAPTDFHDRTHVDLAGAQRWSTDVGRWLDGLCRKGQLPGACAPVA